MKIGEPVPEVSVRSKYDWSPILGALKTLPDGLALPVELETQNQVMALTAFVYSRINSMNGNKYKVQRKALTIYISKAQ